MEADINNRVEYVRNKLAELDIDLFFTAKLENVRYLSGFTGSNGLALISKNDTLFFSDPRYTNQANEEVEGFDIVIGKNIFEDLVSYITKSKKNRIGFESNHFIYQEYINLSKKLVNRTLVPTKNLVEDKRAVKEPEEIKFLNKAIDISRIAFIKSKNRLKVGVSERDIAVELEYNLRKNGAEGIAFDTIVASGERGGLPHGIASDKKLNSGDLVIIDFGAKYGGYFSDCTRTICMGDWSEKKRKVYDIVLSAQKKAIEVIKEGVTSKKVDLSARDYIRESGHDEYFGHGTGHGVGLEIHEPPRIYPEGGAILEHNMVFTIEPGIYIPGWGGVRIEDMILVEKNGCSVMTSNIPK